MPAGPSVTAVHRARARLAGLAHHTPLTRSSTLSRARNADVRLKLESTQDTRSFKVRGAGNVILGLDDVDPERGVVTYSTGNHGRAVVHVAGRLGLPATVCMSTNTTADKRAALREAGATLEIVGDSQDDAAERAAELAGMGYALVDPINDPATTAGHGTIGLELLEDWSDLDTVIVPVSGGALIAGIALAVKSSRSARVIGVSMDRGAAMYESRQAGHPVVIDEVESLADSLQGGITVENTHTFAMVCDLVDEIVLVTEQEIGAAMAESIMCEKILLEGAAATPIAALLFRDRSLFGDRIAIVATGSMVDTGTVVDVLNRYTESAADVVREVPA